MLALRANKFGLSSVSGREDLALRANNGYPLFQAGKVSITC